MEESDPPPAYSLLPSETTARRARIALFLGKVSLTPPVLIPTLVEIVPVDFQAEDAAGEARALLTQERTSVPGYKDPKDQKIRHLFRTTSRKEKKCNNEQWVFTKHEVGKTLDALLSQKPLPEAAVAQALLDHAPDTTLDELWCHFHDSKLEKRMKSILQRSTSSSGILLEEPTWLDRVTTQDNLDYIRLLCQTGFDQDVLDQAFSIALSQNSLKAMELLLRFGAAANACQGKIRQRVELNDIPLVRLLLSAPHAMTIQHWEYCLDGDLCTVKDQGRLPDILLVCSAHRPEVVSANLLLQALSTQNLEATAILLAYAEPDI